MGKKAPAKRTKSDLEPDGGDLPYLLTLEEGKKHNIEIDLDSIEKTKDGGPDGDWSCYRVTLDDEENEEVPFWAMKAFYACIPDEWEDGETLELVYKRKEKNGKNTASFQEA